ncbi:hypothetical protein PUR57_29685 [Streptomyces sp. JV176]|uniref:hypothetical protein n=1 Tax=Streptomyces sp. JV176 TaxID=858630 RepID=UPI002E765D64|nr:hypothetical protein [Streptomyces sp. JV176]MEE1802806.1 hypothetical protein [Streptomyces sp. JV176]
MSDQRKTTTDEKNHGTPTTPEPSADPRGAADPVTPVTPVKPLHAPDAAAGGTRTPDTPPPPPRLAPPAPSKQTPRSGQQPPPAPPVKTGRAAGTNGARPGASDRAFDGGTGKADGKADGKTDGRLFPSAESDRLSQRLQEALNSFVDGPRRSVEEAAGVLEEAARQLTTALAERPRSLRAGWDGDRDDGAADGSDTEELRLALQSYREMTQRLLRV